ncbi:MAG: 1,4-dihydroxy-6-naphthoate synthase [Bacteroidota bacterium]
MKKSYQIGFSPCPNDTFIFDAMINNRLLDNETWLPQLLDVEALNKNAGEGCFEVSKMSFAAYAFVSDKYQILNAGSALGRGCGPLIISKSPLSLEELGYKTIAIPGARTTANLLMSIFVPECKAKEEMVFSDIEEAVLTGRCDAGLIIHENRFTYQQKGLLKVADLGELWELKTGLPIPLGCIAVKRDLPELEKQRIDELIHQSVNYAFKNPSESKEYIAAHAQEMNPEVQQQHIDLYVNDFSVTLGVDGKNAIQTLFEEGRKSGLLPEVIEPLFV